MPDMMSAKTVAS